MCPLSRRDTNVTLASEQVVLVWPLGGPEALVRGHIPIPALPFMAHDGFVTAAFYISIILSINLYYSLEFPYVKKLSQIHDG